MDPFRLLAERSRDLVYRYTFTPVRGFEYVSPSATAITGYSPEDHYADPDLGFKLVHPADRAVLEQAAANPGPDPVVLRWIRQDGSVIWTEQHNVPVFDGSGTLVAIEGTARDVTHRETALAALRASESGLRQLLQRIGLLAAAVDREGRVLYCNDPMLALVGRTEQEVVGTDWFDTFQAPDERQIGRTLYSAAIASGKVAGDVDRKLVAADGTFRRVRMHILPIRDDDGLVAGAAMIGEDLTAAEESATRTAHLTAAIEQTADSIVITDDQARIQYVNPAFERTTGYSYSEVLGENPRILQSGHQTADFYRRMWRRLASGHAWTGEFVNRRRDGTLFIEEASITPIVDGSGATAYVGVKRDVTRVRSLHHSLTTAQRERTEVANAIAMLETGTSLEETADAVASALLSVDGADIGSVIVFEGTDAARVVALASDVALPIRSGMLLPGQRAAYLRERAAQGPWVEAWRARDSDGEYGRAIRAAGVRAVLYAPIGNGSGPVGVLSLAGTAVDASRQLARSVASGMELASAAKSMLGPMIRERVLTRDQTTRIGAIIEGCQFKPVYQPVFNLATGAPVGFEALTRFDSGIRPDLVFAEARAAGLGLELEGITLKAAVTGTRWLPVGTWLSLNVSPALVVDGSRLADVLAARTRPVMLEITEHESVEDYPALRAALAALGPDIMVAADDAGAGIANLGHLVDLRPGFIKLDQAIVRDVDTDLSRQAMVVGLRHFARASDAWLIAEGIETEAELEAFRRLGIRYGQGYLMGRPAPARHWARSAHR